MLRRLAPVVPADMDEQAFLARCRVLHQRWQRMPDGLLRRFVVQAGVTNKRPKEGFGSLKLLQAVCNITDRLNANLERVGDALPTTVEPNGWALRNPHLAALFVTHELRNTDAHPGRDKTRGEVDASIQGSVMEDFFINQTPLGRLVRSTILRRLPPSSPRTTPAG
jgi:hypothetical protein